MKPRSGEKSFRQQLGENLTRQIAFGIYPAGSALPDMAAIAMEYRVSRSLVKQVIGDLVESGLLTRRSGRTAMVGLNRTSPPVIASVWDNPDFSYDEAPSAWYVQQGFIRALQRCYYPHLLLTSENLRDIKLYSGISGIVCGDEINASFIPSHIRCPEITWQFYENESNHNCICFDYQPMFKELTDYFRQHRLKKVIIVFRDRRFFKENIVTSAIPCHDRFYPFYQSCTASGMDVEYFQMPYGNDLDSKLWLERLRSYPRPFGIFVNSDIVAQRFLAFACESQLKIQKDCFIIGDSGLPQSRQHAPYLSSAKIPFQVMADRAVEMLQCRIDSQGENVSSVKLPVHLEILAT